MKDFSNLCSAVWKKYETLKQINRIVKSIVWHDSMCYKIKKSLPSAYYYILKSYLENFKKT